jgi:hypothetical protein
MRPEPKDGGAAFPMKEALTAHFNPDQYSSHGMTLRDYFAGQALASSNLRVENLHDYELIAMFGKDRVGIDRHEIAAAQAYRWADAMLAARKART